MHQLTLLLADTTAHEASKTAFYICGGLLAAWAMVLAFLGFSRPDLPGSIAVERGIIAVSAVLVVGAIGTAIGTASTPASAGPYTKTINAGRPAGIAPAPTMGLTTATTPAQSANAPAASTPGVLALAADPNGGLSYTTPNVTAATKGGKLTINLTNASQIPHNVAVANAAGRELGTTPTFTGGTKSVTLSLPPGTYTFYCTVPGHRQAGMQGTLTVK